MSLFDEIVKTVDKTVEPGLESLTETEISGIAVNGDFDVDEDPMLGMAMEAMGKDVQYDADKDPEAAGYSDEDIKKLSDAGAAEEDEDDDYSEETIGDLLDGFVEAVYGDPEDEDPTGLLSDDDLDDIDDDFEDGMESWKSEPAQEAISDKKDLKSTKKRIEALEKELKANKSTCDAISANVKRLHKKSKRDAEALKDIISFNDSFATQMVRQAIINAEIADLKDQINSYKNDVALEKEARQEAKDFADEVKDIIKDSAKITVIYNDAANEIEDLAKDVIAEVKQETPKEGSFWDKVKKLISDASGSVTNVSTAQKKMVAVAAEGFCLGEDIDMIAEECYIDFVRVCAEKDEYEIAEESNLEEPLPVEQAPELDVIDLVKDTLEAFEGYFCENVDEIDNLYPAYSSLLDMKAALESINEDEKDEESIKKEIKICETWIKHYGSQAVTNPSNFLEREITKLKNRIAELNANLKDLVKEPTKSSSAVASNVA